MNAHDILLCVKDGEKQATPGRGRGYRYGLLIRVLLQIR
jgi:DNA polymerase-3 subunit alpha